MLERFSLDEPPECPTYKGAAEDAEHIFFICTGFESLRGNLEADPETRLRLENVISHMVGSDIAWIALIATTK